MTEMPIEVDANPVTRVAINLSEIVDLYGYLQDQAINHANDPLMPGGLAMVALADIASLEEWAEQVEASEHKALTKGTTAQAPEDDDDWEPPLQTLIYWSEAWRKARGYDLRPRPTLTSEIGFIRNSLSWAWDHEPRWDAFAEDVHKARTRIENLLKAGNRDQISDDVTCIVCETRLRRRMTSRGYEDEWWCIDCHHHLTNAQYNLSASAAARRAVANLD